jgi:hypothetical protein
MFSSFEKWLKLVVYGGWLGLKGEPFVPSCIVGTKM